MKVIHLDQAERYEPQADWKRSSLCDQPSVSVEHFVKPPRHASPVHEHPQDQVTIVLRGRMKVLTGEGDEDILGEGDAAFFPGGEPHQIVNDLDEPSIGVDIFCPRRSFDFWRQRLG
jgi:quercetin dioxygenase-like cupin family protein